MLSDLSRRRTISLHLGRAPLCLLGILLCVASVSAVVAAPAIADLPSFNWSAPLNVDGIAPVASISCPSSSLCVATDDEGSVVTSTDPTGGEEAWAYPIWVDDPPELRSLHAVSCVSTPSVLCAGADMEGHVVTSTDPTGEASAWSVSPLTGNEVIPWSISCASASLCVIGGDDEHGGDLFTSTDPTGGGADWHTTLPLFEGHRTGAYYGLSCPSASLCVTAGEELIFTSSNPTGGASAWHGISIGPDFLLGVSCVPSTTLCVAYDGGGNVFTSTNPAGGSGAWTKTDIDGGNELTGVSCTGTPTVLCVAIDHEGNVITSTDPTGGSGAWTVTHVDEAQLTSVSCASTTLCVVGDAEGNVLTPSTGGGGNSGGAGSGGSGSSTSTATTTPETSPKPAAPGATPTCRKGFRSKKVKGKDVCVRVKKHRRHKHHPKHKRAG